jgi:chitinase
MVSYDTASIAARKAEYIKHLGLGGAMWWESSADHAPHGERGEESLIRVVAEGLGGYEGRHLEKVENALEYPQSKFENLRKGMPGE